MVVVLEFGFVGLCLAWGSAAQRRSRFWLRVALACVAIAVFPAALFGVSQLNVLSDNVGSTLLPSLLLIGVGALICAPATFFRKPNSSPGLSGSDGDDGPDPPTPPPSPDPSRGGVPLLDADQATARARDHGTPKFPGLKRRRPDHKPGRAPVRTNE